MELYVGGCGQGKLEYVLKKHPEIAPGAVFDAVSGDPAMIAGYRIINHFHMLVRRGVSAEVIEHIIASDDLIIISDEVGLGVIPDNRGDIEYRESVGRYLCRIAAAADHFERIICGIGQRIK